MKRFIFISALIFGVVYFATADRRGLFSVSAGSAPASATDTFNRADSDPMSTTMSDGVAVWENGPGAMNQLAISGNALYASSAASRGCSVSTPAFAVNQTATITLTTDVGVGVTARIKSSTEADGYLVYLLNSTTLQIYRIDDTGSLGFVQLGSNITISSVTAGDTVGIGISGTTITAYRNGVSAGTQTDATYSTGQPGAYLGGSVVKVESWTASDL